jgi:hypothetical protein
MGKVVGLHCQHVQYVFTCQKHDIVKQPKELLLHRSCFPEMLEHTFGSRADLRANKGHCITILIQVSFLKGVLYESYKRTSYIMIMQCPSWHTQLNLTQEKVCRFLYRHFIWHICICYSCLVNYITEQHWYKHFLCISAYTRISYLELINHTQHLCKCILI